MMLMTYCLWMYLYHVALIRTKMFLGLGMVLLINTLLAVGSVFKAGERGQSQALWAIKVCFHFVVDVVMHSSHTLHI